MARCVAGGVPLPVAPSSYSLPEAHPVPLRGSRGRGRARGDQKAQRCLPGVSGWDAGRGLVQFAALSRHARPTLRARVSARRWGRPVLLWQRPLPKPPGHTGFDNIGHTHSCVPRTCGAERKPAAGGGFAEPWRQGHGRKPSRAPPGKAAEARSPLAKPVGASEGPAF